MVLFLLLYVWRVDEFWGYCLEYYEFFYDDYVIFYYDFLFVVWCGVSCSLWCCKFI